MRVEYNSLPDVIDISEDEGDLRKLLHFVKHNRLFIESEDIQKGIFAKIDKSDERIRIYYILLEENPTPEIRKIVIQQISEAIEPEWFEWSGGMDLFILLFDLQADLVGQLLSDAKFYSAIVESIESGDVTYFEDPEHELRTLLGSTIIQQYPELIRTLEKFILKVLESLKF